MASLTAQTATLGGTLSAGADPVSYFFQYAPVPIGLEAPNASVTTPRTLAPFSIEAPVSVTVGGLTASTTYRYRLCGKRAADPAPICLRPRSFTTPESGYFGFVFNTPGTAQTYTVPAGVTRVTFDALGAEGGKGIDPASATGAEDGVAVANVAGGKGARVRSALTVAPGDRIVVRVGSAGGDAASQPFAAGTLLSGPEGPGTPGAGGTNGVDRGGSGGTGGGGFRGTGAGGGGGGAPTRIELQPVAGGPAQIVALAAGGGGAGGGAWLSRTTNPVTPGGNGGKVGVRGTGGRAGSGGGGGGTSTGPGNGGDPGGIAGAGTKGGDGATDLRHVVVGRIEVGRGGGGGGGGYFGGGGGASGDLLVPATGTATENVPSGGGGGSSFTFPGTAIVPVFQAGVGVGDGTVTLSYAPAN